METARIEKSIYIGTPTYDGRCFVHTGRSAMRASALYPTKWDDYGSSLLAKAFNVLWSRALTSGFTHFAMLHADIAPSFGWVDGLMEIMDEREADVVSVVMPIKSEDGLTSTALDCSREGDPSDVIRLTMAEVMELPETFSFDDAKQLAANAHGLLINTGCMLIDLRKPWAKQFTGFTIRDRLRWEGETLHVMVEPEDWGFSRWLDRWYQRRDEVAKVYATRSIRAYHLGGNRHYPNFEAWGNLEHDRIPE